MSKLIDLVAWGLERDYTWATWAKKMHPAISPEP